MDRTVFPQRMALLLILAVAAGSLARDVERSALPEPRTAGGRPLMAVLKDRKTTREFSDQPVSRQVLSDLLWAAAGVNRPESGKRTAPSAMNAQEIDVYVALESGLFLYEPREHVLSRTLSDDIRTKTGGQEFVKKAPVSLVFVADPTRMTKASEEQRAFYSATDTGYISQNVYLFCASEGLGTVVHDGIDRKLLAGVMKLRPDQKIILAQCVGYPE